MTAPQLQQIVAQELIDRHIREVGQPKPDDVIKTLIHGKTIIQYTYSQLLYYAQGKHR